MTYDARDAALCAIQAEEFHWFIAAGEATSGGIALPGSPATAHSLAEIALSPSQKYLAINEADEGHPLVSIVDFELWLNQGSIRTIWRAAVYPGYISIGQWQGELLVVTSNHDLTRPDRLHLAPDAEDFQQDQDFLLDPETGNISIIGTAGLSSPRHAH